MPRITRNLAYSAVVLSFLMLAFGCSSTKTVTVTSEPTGAKVYLNGTEKGISPLTTELEFKKIYKYDVVARLDGYEDGQAVITYEPTEKTLYAIPPLKKKEYEQIPLVSVEPQPTAQGVKLVKTTKPTLAYLETIERSPNMKSVTRVTDNQDKIVQLSGPLVSPIGDILVYQILVEETGGTLYSNIWRQNIGSSATTRVTYGKSVDLSPCFTPDGQYIVFGSNRAAANSTLWRVKVEGTGGLTKITGTSAEDFAPSISPDGGTIAYASNLPEADEPQIWTVRADGSLPTQLREGESPRVSPDGKQILFVRKNKDSGKKQIWVMNVDGSAETVLTPKDVDYDTVDPNWSPDGKWIVFASDEGLDSQKRRNFDIWVMASDGSKKTQLTTNGSRDDSPCYDSAGQFIYFRSNRGGTWNIWRFEPVMP